MVVQPRPHVLNGYLVDMTDMTDNIEYKNFPIEYNDDKNNIVLKAIEYQDQNGVVIKLQ